MRLGLIPRSFQMMEKAFPKRFELTKGFRRIHARKRVFCLLKLFYRFIGILHGVSWLGFSVVADWQIEPDGELAGSALYQRSALEGFVWTALTVPDNAVKGLRGPGG